MSSRYSKLEHPNIELERTENYTIGVGSSSSGSGNGKVAQSQDPLVTYSAMKSSEKVKSWEHAAKLIKETSAEENNTEPGMMNQRTSLPIMDFICRVCGICRYGHLSLQRRYPHPFIRGVYRELLPFETVPWRDGVPPIN